MVLVDIVRSLMELVDCATNYSGSVVPSSIERSIVLQRDLPPGALDGRPSKRVRTGRGLYDRAGTTRAGPGQAAEELGQLADLLRTEVLKEEAVNAADVRAARFAELCVAGVSQL